MASESNQGQKRPCFENLDRISSLPDEVLHKILIHLPIRETVITSMLSRSWRYRWLSIPELVFDERSIIQSQKFDKWVGFIDNVLLLHDGNITQFKVGTFSDSASPNMDRWLLLLSRKKLSHLSIHFQSPSSYMCPLILFCFQDLRNLSLEGCDLQLPLQTQFGGFRNLTRLHLVRANVNMETVEFLVNNSPLLKDLRLVPGKSVLPHLSISAPNLRKCYIAGMFGGIVFVNTPKLHSLSIRIYHDVAKPARYKFDGILGGLVQLYRINIYPPFLEFLSINSFSERLQITYYDLKVVRMVIDFEDPKQILAALWFFRSSPAVKKIIIKVLPLGNGVHDKDTCLDDLYKILGKKEAVFHKVKIFELEEFRGSNNELRFVQFALLNAIALQTMNINWKVPDIARDTLIRAALKLTEFPRTAHGLKVNNLPDGLEKGYI